MYCPKCGSQNVTKQNQSPNGGELYVAEDMDSCVEWYDDAFKYKCDDCNTVFYLSNDI